MRPFWRSFWASILAYIVLSTLVIFLINVVVFSLAGSLMQSDGLKISDSSYLEMNLNFDIKERGGIETTNDFNNPISKSYGIHQIGSVLEDAKNDERIRNCIENFQC